MLYHDLFWQKSHVPDAAPDEHPLEGHASTCHMSYGVCCINIICTSTHGHRYTCNSDDVERIKIDERGVVSFRYGSLCPTLKGTPGPAACHKSFCVEESPLRGASVLVSS